MSTFPNKDVIQKSNTKDTSSNSDLEKQNTHLNFGEDLNPKAAKTLGAGVSRWSSSNHEMHAKYFVDCPRYWCLRDYSDDSFTEPDGMARRDNHERLRCQFLLRRCIWSRGHCAMGTLGRERVRVYGFQRIW